MMSKTSNQAPAKREIVSVDSQRRFYFNRSIIEEVLEVKLAPGQVGKLWMSVGERRQLQVLKKEHDLSKLRERYEAGTLGIQPDWEEGDSEEADIIRKLSDLMEIRFRRENESPTLLHITLPPETIQRGLAKIKSFIVVFTAEKLFELWDTQIWNEAHKISNLKEFTKQVQGIAGS